MVQRNLRRAVENRKSICASRIAIHPSRIVSRASGPQRHSQNTQRQDQSSKTITKRKKRFEVIASKELLLP